LVFASELAFQEDGSKKWSFMQDEKKKAINAVARNHLNSITDTCLSVRSIGISATRKGKKKKKAPFARAGKSDHRLANPIKGEATLA